MYETKARYATIVLGRRLVAGGICATCWGDAPAHPAKIMAKKPYTEVEIGSFIGHFLLAALILVYQPRGQSEIGP